VLEQAGHRVTAVLSAPEAIESMANDAPEVLVLDVTMEEFDAGFQLAHEAAIRFPTLPILLLAAVGDYLSDAWRRDRDPDRGWLPVHRFLEKPVTPDQLIAAVRDALAQTAASNGRTGCPGRT
jgi:CheY-like chemotaxis protein